MPDAPRHYTATELMSYHAGTMPPAQMHELEKAALNDPLLQEALDGYALLIEADEKSRQQAMAALHRARLAGSLPQQEKHRAPVIPFWRRRVVQMAAAASIMLAISLSIWQPWQQQQAPTAAETAAASTPNATPAQADSNGVPPDVAIQTVPTAPTNMNNQPVPPTPVAPPAPATTPRSAPNLEESPAPAASKETAPAPRQEVTSVPTLPLPQESATPAQANAKKQPDNEVVVTARQGAATSRQRNLAAPEQQPVQRPKTGPSNAFIQNQGASNALLPAQGQVVNTVGEPIEYAIIRDTQGKTIAQADALGRFEAQLPDTLTPVIAQAPGYTAQRSNLRPGPQQNNRIPLQAANRSLEETVVADMLTQKAIAPTLAITVQAPTSNTARPTGGIKALERYLQGYLSHESKVPAGQATLRFGFDVEKRPASIKALQSTSDSLSNELARALRDGRPWILKTPSDTAVLTIQVIK